ncbi:WG repeat-containing protein [Clostridium oceanicum]|uniref:DUF3298 domain-containing protein n=1 Tax=Clostridium oceanicum TaxID=1543 RepID=A0ABP3UJE4_9CLOT
MWNPNFPVQLVKNFIPLDAKLIIMNDPYRHFAIYFIDFDCDGILEIVSYYTLKEKKYVMVLKNLYGIWYKIADYDLKNKFCSRSTPPKKIKLYPASIKTKEGSKWGFIDDNGNFIIKPQYDFAYDFQENGLAIVSKDDLVGIIDTSGNYIVPIKYGSIEQFSDGRSIVTYKDTYKVIDETGKIVTKNPHYTFIQNYKDERALFTKKDTNHRKEVCGYLDREGNEVIPAKYEDGTSFNSGKAIVKIHDNNYSLINKEGKILNSYSYFYVGEPREGLLQFKKSADSKYGYIDESGKIIINPIFYMAFPFLNGRAVVCTSENFADGYGLIDKMGRYVIPPKFNNMNQLGENRVSVGMALNTNKPRINLKYSIADINGNFLTNFKFNDIFRYNKGFACASDGKKTFFVNKKGNISKTLPIVKGIGILSFIGDLVSSLMDTRTSYYDKNGKLVWKQNNIIKLNNMFSIKEDKFKPTNNYFVYIPQVEGMENKLTQKRVNTKLFNLSNFYPKSFDKNVKSTYSGDFEVKFFKKDLLVLNLYGYEFPLGAAHGMPNKTYPHINLVTGEFYKLKDLFKKDSDYVKILSSLIKYQIKNEPQYSCIFPHSYKGISKDQPFYLDDNNLYIYFTPYEIAPYSAGFPTFKIPYEEIIYIINTKGSLWTSFH